MKEPLQEHFQHCADYLREHDYGRYISCLFLHTEIRPSAFAIYAFHHKIREVPKLVSEPMPGEIRIQWWRDLIGVDAEISVDPFGRALQETIRRFDLPRERIDNLLEAHIFDLYQDPMPDLQALEAYLGETHASILVLVNLIAGQLIAEKSGLGGRISRQFADACGHAGVYIGLAELLKSEPYHRHTERRYFPVNLGLAVRYGPNNKIENSTGSIGDFRSYATSHFQSALEAIAALDGQYRILFNQLFLAHHELNTILDNREKGRSTIETVSRLRVLWTLWRGQRQFAKLSQTS